MTPSAYYGDKTHYAGEGDLPYIRGLRDAYLTALEG